MNKDSQKLLKIQERISTRDAHEQIDACDEALKWIDSLSDIGLQNSIRALIIGTLLDLNKLKEWKECAQFLKKSEDYHLQLIAVHSEGWFYRKHNDFANMRIAYQQGISIAEDNNDYQSLAECCMGEAKSLLFLAKWNDALIPLNRSISAAREIFNYKMIAVANYYIGLVMRQLGYHYIAYEKLRDTSDLAIEQHAQGIAMHTENVRASWYLEDGDTETAKNILNDWNRNFGMML